MGQGDVLARGAKSATFGPAKVSQAKWDAIWESEETPAVEVSNQSEHTEQESQKEI